jgi:acylglycerol lipase
MCSVHTEDGERMRCYRSVPAGDAPLRAVFVLLPGLGEPASRLVHVAEHFVARGCAVYSLDYPGYGCSGGLRGYIPSMDRLVAQLATRLQHFHAAHRPAPLYLLGQSLGGAMALRCELHLGMRGASPLAGLLLLAPAIHSDLHPLLQRLAGVVGALLPRLPVVSLCELDRGSSNLAVAADLLDDVHFYRGRIRARTGAELVRSCAYLREHLHRVRTPFVVVHGERDLIIPPSATHLLLRRTADGGHLRLPGQRVAHWLQDCWHDLLHSPRYEEVMSRLDAWLDAQPPAGVTPTS